MKARFFAVPLALAACFPFGGKPQPVTSPTNPPAATPAQPVQQSEPEWDPAKSGIGDLTEGPPPIESSKKPKKIDIVGRLFTKEQFAAYVKKSIVPVLKKQGQWRPSFIVLHHTGIPSIKQRPNGFTTPNMHSLATFYGEKQRWRSGPHLFVDQNGIWVFTDLLKKGTHSPSWNDRAWGIEQLGNFSLEDYETGNGEKIRDNAIAAIAILSLARNLNIDTLHFHFEDPKTTHKECPGSTCKKPDVISKVKSEIKQWRTVWPTL